MINPNNPHFDPAMTARMRQLAQIRPTFIVGAGGTGQMTLTHLKNILQTRFGDAWSQKIRLLAFDTAEEAFVVSGDNGAVSLEPAVEFISIGNVPVPGIRRSLDRQDAIRERLGAVMTRLPPVVLRNGAKQLRPLGLLSLLWNFSLVNQEIRQALWKLAGRDQIDNTTLSQQQGINVFICGSLVGGTGSGIFLDLAQIIRAFFTELGAQADFCHLTGIGVLPQAFPGIKGPNLLPNTAAALEELNHQMVKGGFRSRYPGGRLIESHEAVFDLFYVIDGVDARGQTWGGIHDVAALIAEGIYLQTGSQLGRKGENDFDNLDEALIGQTPDGQGNFLASFGTGHLVFDAPAAASLCTRWFLLELIRQVWRQPPQAELADSALPALLDGLTPRALETALRQEPESGGEMQIDLGPPPAWLRRKPADEVAAETSQYLSEYGQARVGERYTAAVRQQSRRLLAKRQTQWQNWLQATLLSPEISLLTTQKILRQSGEVIQRQMQAAGKQAAALEQQVARQKETVAQLETAVAKAAASFVLGRKGRIHTALSRVFQAAHLLFETELTYQVIQAQARIWRELNVWLQEQTAAVTHLEQRLFDLERQLAVDTERQAGDLAAGGVARISLADPAYMQTLYQQNRPGFANVKEQIGDPLPLTQMSRTQLESRLLEALSPAFTAVADLTIEQVIRSRSQEMSPRARRQQLFRLATPSWSVDRARLPDGGASLARLEVMGVPDADHTLFADNANLVSTHDPHRLTALVVVAGAPASALQQYDLYRRALAQAGGKRPFHVLPHFMKGDEEGRLVFALGSIFKIIYSQGAYFYYKPADPLAPPVKLGNGLSNAIQYFIEADGLAQETKERVEARIAQRGLRESINVLTGYYSAPVNGSSASLDERLRELKRLVRDYADDLRRIDAFGAGMETDTGNPSNANP